MRGSMHRLRYFSKVTIAVFVIAATVFGLSSTKVYAAYPPDATRIHRFYNKVQNTHFYSANNREAAQVYKNQSSTYRYEGVAYYGFANNAPDKLLVHRFYNFQKGTHFYTANQSEASHVNATMSGTYRHEGVTYYAPSQPLSDGYSYSLLHRFYNLQQGTHFYTASQNEATHVNDTMHATYRYEGVAYSVLTNTNYTVPSTVHYPYCADAKNAGVAPVIIGDAGYASHLDSDTDGIACEW